MKTRLVSISKLQTAKVMAALYLVISIPLALVSMIPLALQGQPVSVVMLLLVPVLYTAIGFVFTFLGAWLYNGIAARIGGIEFTTATAKGE
ncbi:hypothetical protein [uncultured Massilia sp.]|uniref:hypothetical protein n=1 Tax=uncultured Massilia sp. TaxID=169973 RepID=UPI0025F82C6A|nr:hypothetical protein [uncultured Massilia sp.]